jgi:Domain found in Dishevelled, Egl-10, and Pleckstrin (DEP)
MAEFDDTGLFTGDSEGDEKDFLLSVATAMSHTLEVGTFSRSKLGIGQRFAGVFRGKAAVDWLIGRNYALGREDALQLGTALIKAGWIMHCRKPGERLKDKSTSLYKCARAFSNGFRFVLCDSSDVFRFTDELRSAIDQKAADARRHVVLSSSKHLVHSFETPVRTPVASTRPSELEVPHAIESVDVDLATERQQDGADAAQGEIGPEPLSFPGPIPQLIDHTQDFEEIRTKLVQVRLSMHSTSVSIRRLERNTLTLSPHEQAVVSAALAGVSLLFHALGVSDPSLAKKVATWLHRLKWFPRMRLEKSLHAVVVLCRAVVVATSLFLLMQSCLLMFMFGLGQVCAHVFAVLCIRQ